MNGHSSWERNPGFPRDMPQDTVTMDRRGYGVKFTQKLDETKPAPFLSGTTSPSLQYANKYCNFPRGRNSLQHFPKHFAQKVLFGIPFSGSRVPWGRLGEWKDFRVWISECPDEESGSAVWQLCELF